MVPVYVGGVEIEGRVDRGVNMVGVDLSVLPMEPKPARENRLLMNRYRDTIRSLLTPTITLSSTTPHGTTLTITLSTNTTSFLTGLFAFPNSTTKSFEASVLAVADFREKYVLPGTSMVCFPTSLVVTCIWTVVCLSVQGRGMCREWRAREEYRWRVRKRRRCGENRSWYGV